MRRLVLSALVLLPVLASAQTSTSAASQSSATLQAKSTAPAGLPPAPAAAAPSAAELMVPVHQTLIDESNTDDSTLGYVSTAQHLSAPKLLHAVPLELSLQDMRSEPEIATIVVNLTVTSDGKPANITIVHSGGAALDQRARVAVAQYLFKPATEDNIPVASTATVSFKLKKS